ncbi:MAG: ABC transporter permease, partial [Acetatifactor sp.]|nr:ABC transporter permease [Acetatifactor sp.]
MAYLESQLDYSGAYDIIIPDISNENLNDYVGDERFSAAGILYRGGTITTFGSEVFYFGALSNTAVDLYHFTTDKGRYPERSGEITAYRSFFEANGCAAQIGNRLNLELCNFEGNVIEKREFTIAGVLENERGTDINRSLGGQISYIFPQVFLWWEDMPENSACDLLANYAVDTDIQQMKSEWENKGIVFYYGGRIAMMNTVAHAPITELSELGLNEALGKAHKDFYAYALIPAFSGVVLIVAFVSVYNVISTSLSERKRQLAMLQCIGMERRQAVKMALKESFFMVTGSVVLGFVLGVAIY